MHSRDAGVDFAAFPARQNARVRRLLVPSIPTCVVSLFLGALVTLALAEILALRYALEEVEWTAQERRGSYNGWALTATEHWNPGFLHLEVNGSRASREVSNVGGTLERARATYGTQEPPTGELPLADLIAADPVLRTPPRDPFEHAHVEYAAAGWPFLAMEGRIDAAERRVRSGAVWAPGRSSSCHVTQWSSKKRFGWFAQEGTHAFPLRPRIPGFIADSILIGAMIEIAFTAARLIVRTRGLRIWPRRGACRACGYRVGALARCPECGCESPAISPSGR